MSATRAQRALVRACGPRLSGIAGGDPRRVVALRAGKSGPQALRIVAGKRQLW